MEHIGGSNGAMLSGTPASTAGVDFASGWLDRPMPTGSWVVVPEGPLNVRAGGRFRVAAAVVVVVTCPSTAGSDGEVPSWFPVLGLASCLQIAFAGN